MGAVEVTRSGGVATVVMERPPANAMTPEFVGAVVDAVVGLGNDPEVRCIVLRSALERIWMAGADLGAMAGGLAGSAGAGEVGLLARRLLAVERVEKPVVAAITGHALGGGCELALCCDYRVMVDDGRASIGLTETSLGLLPGAGGTQRLPRLVGRGRGLRMIVEATRVKAPEALEIGLVDLIAGSDGYEAALGELAERLAAMATRAVGLAKRAVVLGLEGSVEEGLGVEAAAFAEVLATEDVREGVGAFLEKRPPRFSGR